VITYAQGRFHLFVLDNFLENIKFEFEFLIKTGAVMLGFQRPKLHLGPVLNSVYIFSASGCS
jgi:hypothetical protein